MASKPKHHYLGLLCWPTRSCASRMPGLLVSRMAEVRQGRGYFSCAKRCRFSSWLFDSQQTWGWKGVLPAFPSADPLSQLNIDPPFLISPNGQQFDRQGIRVSICSFLPSFLPSFIQLVSIWSWPKHPHLENAPGLGGPLLIISTFGL